MKTVQFKKVIVFAVIPVVLISAIYLLINRGNDESEDSDSEDVRTVKTLNINAADDKFEPAEITTELFADLNLEIKAEDKDYYFSVDGYPRFNTDIKKGETKMVQLYSLGVGEYNYFCSDKCGGKIIVKQQIDTEEGEND